MRVVFFQRKPYDFHFSIEKLFDTLRANFPKSISYTIFTLPYLSQGVFSRLRNGLAAYKHQGQINHITGDIHFITPFLNKNITINTFHDFTFLKNSTGIKHALLKYFWVTLPVKRSRYITVISQTTKEEIIQLTHCSEDKIFVIPNIIPSHITFQPKTFNTNKPTILHIGTTPNKNLNRLIEALAPINCHLTIIGKLNPLQRALLSKHAISFSNKYQLTDDELLNEYKTCDLVSFCSLNEGFGLPILEAQAVGRPIITSNISSMPEVAGDGACLVDPYNILAIKDGIQKIIEDKSYQDLLIQNGIKNIKRFQSSVVANQYIELYQRIVPNICCQ